MTRTFRVLLLSAACSLALQAHAQGSAGPTVPITIPAGDLTQLLLENPTGAIGADEAVPGGAEDSVVKPLPRRPKHKRGGQR